MMGALPGRGGPVPGPQPSGNEGWQKGAPVPLALLAEDRLVRELPQCQLRALRAA
jgi:hypothetical protein